MPLKSNRTFQRLRNTLSPRFKQGLSLIIMQMRGKRLPLRMQYQLFHQLWSEQPKLTMKQRVLLTFYVQFEAGLLNDMDSLGEVNASAFTAQAASSIPFTAQYAPSPLAPIPQVNGNSIAAVDLNPVVPPSGTSGTSWQTAVNMLQNALDSDNEISEMGSI